MPSTFYNVLQLSPFSLVNLLKYLYLSIKDGKMATIRETGSNNSLAIAWAIGMAFFFLFFPFPTLFQVLFGLFLLFTFFAFFCLLAYTWAHFFTLRKK